MNRDKLNFTAPQQAMQATYAAISTLQDFPAHQGVIAAAILIQGMSSVLGIPVSELLDKAGRITRDLNEHYQPEIKALREYIKHEMSR